MAEFVVQKHKATTLHYDFRLEISDVLKSWAVPKGPSMDPTVKRLAVETTDHNLSYRFFEGEIPQGKYGAGEVIVWDRGKYKIDNDGASDKTPQECYESGKIEFILKGKKLKGRFLLVKTDMPGKNKNWLLIKRHDKYITDEDILKTKPGSVVSVRRIE
ncbi:MAG: DNA polymerase ligase N-terminal domain-containing protein [Elusimicrobiota bacterium]|nr:DNA polymerase ligase N-terminal domain-containing protein [Elusimicrobiota bacterium]